LRFCVPSATSRCLVAAAVALAATVLAAAPAGAAVAPGGLGAPGKVALADVTCVAKCVDTHKVTPGAKVRVRGVAMDQVRHVAFRGASGPVMAAPLLRSEKATTARVPRGALSGRPFVIDTTGKRSRRSPHRLYVLPPSAVPEAIFPIRGPHSFWDGFGAGRGHQGADIGARCGTPLVAALPGKVTRRATHAAAGNYLVIKAEGIKAELVYMHMARPALRRPGQVVGAGQAGGYVGVSGNASGCHLHFVDWQGRYWGGGSPVDPVPYLREWDGDGDAPARRARRAASTG